MKNNGDSSNQILHLSEEINNEQLDMKNTCKLLKIHLDEFYDDIYIPFTKFREHKWDVHAVLTDNKDALFYKKDLLTKKNEKKFEIVFNKYRDMVMEIFSTNNNLILFLKKWTDMSRIKWKSATDNSFLKYILTRTRYQCISPRYTADLYNTYTKKYNNDHDKLKCKIIKKLDNIYKNTVSELKIFEKKYNKILELYVLNCPRDNEINKNHLIEFLNNLISEILNVSNKLIELNIYAIHPIVANIIEYYTPLDEYIMHLDYQDECERTMIIV